MIDRRRRAPLFNCGARTRHRSGAPSPACCLSASSRQGLSQSDLDTPAPGRFDRHGERRDVEVGEVSPGGCSKLERWIGRRRAARLRFTPEGCSGAGGKPPRALAAKKFERASAQRASSWLLWNSDLEQASASALRSAPGPIAYGVASFFPVEESYDVRGRSRGRVPGKRELEGCRELGPSFPQADRGHALYGSSHTMGREREASAPTH